MAILEVEHINKTFGRTEVLKDISFSLERGQVLSLIGSSGSGKTTLLRCLNFLETPDKGVIRMKRLHFGLVFQSFNQADFLQVVPSPALHFQVLYTAGTD